MRRLATIVVLAAACSSVAPTPAAASASPARAATSAPATPAASAAPAPAKAAAVNAIGAYTFVTDVNGTPVSGTLVITRDNGTWGGRMTSDVFPQLPVTSVGVEGQTVRVTADTPNGSVQIVMNFVGDDYSGTWELGGQQGAVTGKRIQ